MKKILVCVGTRADALKMCPLYLELKRRSRCEVRLLNCGQHKELTDAVLGQFSITPNYSLGIMKRGQDPHEVAALARARTAELLRSQPPDLILVHGDTASSLGCAEAGYEAGIPVAHIEAGLRSGDERDPYPEEIFRKRITKLSAWHFAPTGAAKKNLLAEGVEEGCIFVVGNTVTDALLSSLGREGDACELVRGLDYGRGVLLLTCHRRENLDEAGGVSAAERIFRAAEMLLNAHEGLTVVFPIHKNERVREIFASANIKNERLILCEPLDHPSLVYLLARASAVLSDSGGICEEAVSLCTPVVIARERTERTEALDAGLAVLSGTDTNRIFECVSELLKKKKRTSARGILCDIYGDGRVCGRIADVLYGLE